MKAAPITSPVPPWRTPPETLVLGSDEVHVWRATLDQTPSQRQCFLHNLAADEQARAERFYFERDREHFIVARGVLRAILGGYLNRAPECLSFCYSSHGKPSLAGESEGDAIRFSVSHSGGVALYAVTRGREVGIDIERIRSDLAVAEIAERFFSPREVATLRELPAEAQTSGILLLLDAQGGLHQGPGRRTFHYPWTSLTCRWLPGNRPQYSALNEIPPKPPVGLFRNLPLLRALLPLLPWQDTAGALRVGNGRTRISHQSECRNLFLFRAHLSASRLTIQ